MVSRRVRDAAAAPASASGDPAVTAAARMSRDRVAVLAGLAAPLVLAVILVPFRSGLPNTDAALALILVVVAVAASGHRLAGVLAAVSAAAWFDFFLTVPYERFTITRRADIETTVLLLAIGAAVTEIAVRGRRQHAAAARRAGYLDGINAAARAVATGRVRGGADQPGLRAADRAAAAVRLPVPGRGSRDRPPGPAAARRDGRVRCHGLGHGAGRASTGP